MGNKVLQSNIDVIVALAGLVVGIAGVLASEYYNLNRTHLGCAVCIACLGYLAVNELLPEKESAHGQAKWKAMDWLFISATVAFLVLLLASIPILTSSLYRRPPVYFGLLLGAATTLILQAVLLDLGALWKQQVLLGQILLLGISLKSGAFFLYPSVSGVDPFAHRRWIEELIATGEFPKNTSYTPFPVMHLLAGAASIICDSSSKTGLFFISILHSIALLAVFPIGKKLSSARTGLIAALLLSLSDYEIQWGVQIIPTSLGITWFLMTLMALTKRESAVETQEKLGWTVSIFFFLWAMLFTHTLSTFILLVTLLTILTTTTLLTLSKASSGSTVVSVTLIGLLGITMLAHWMWSFPRPEQDFFTRTVLSAKSALSVAQLGSVEMVSVTGSLDAWTVFAGEAGWTLLLVPAIMGLISSVSSRLRNREFLIWAQLTAVFLGVVYGSGIMGVQQILPSRWIGFLYVPACLLAASFLSRLLAASKSKVLMSSCAVLLIGTVVVLMITAPGRSTPDSPLYATRLSVRPGFYASELAGMDYAKNAYQNHSAASARSVRFLHMADIIDPRKPNSYESANPIVVREPDIRTGFYIPFAKPQHHEIVMPTHEFLEHLNGPSRVRVYDNGTVQLFLSMNYTGTVRPIE